ncbi:hypothetical protein [Sinobaca sp. H24]|uniref:hypothetical protein n=1 Tax=Sinobaca sp. H24 TaxID=2923376 RepID=UPI00207A4B54|nr:hypothetical protein [Sinobaca sp. H24]
MAKNWMAHPWVDRFIPDHRRQVEDQIFSDAHGLVMIQDIEAALDRLIEFGKQVKTTQTFKKSGKTFYFRLRVNQKRMRLLSYETYKSEAAIKKRVTIEYVRKAYNPGSKQNRFKEAYIQYRKNGETYLRSIRKSRFFQGVFYKLEQLDDQLLGRLPALEPAASSALTTEDKHFVDSSEEPFQFIYKTESHIKLARSGLSRASERCLIEIVQEAREITQHYDLLDLEERYTVKRMLQKDIPSLLEAYRLLSPDNQLIRQEELTSTLRQMRSTLEGLHRKVDALKAERVDYLFKLHEKRYPPKDQR